MIDSCNMNVFEPELQEDECRYAEYDMEGKHCNHPCYPDRLFTVSNKQCNNCKLRETNAEEETRTAGIQLDLEKISFADLKKLEYMVDEELKSRRSELDAMIDDFRKPLEALLSSNKVSIYCNVVDEGEIKSFFDFSFCEK